MTDTRQAQAKPGLGTQLWGALKSAVVQDDPIAEARRAKAARPAADAAPAATPATVPTEALSPMAAALLKVVLSKATAYTALTDKLAPLEPIVADERTRYQAAYALIKSSRTVEQVVQSIDMQHMQAVDDEVARFAGQMKDKERTAIGAREEEARALTSKAEAAGQQIEMLRRDLEDRIRELEAGAAKDRQRLDAVTREIEDQRQNLDVVRRQFDSAVDQVRDVLKAARVRVLTFLA